MKNIELNKIKKDFKKSLELFVSNLKAHISDDSSQWTIKGFVDVYKNIYTISADTKVISKILEIHIFPQILKFASVNGYNVVLPNHQNYYPDISFVNIDNPEIIFAVDFKTTYRLLNKPTHCNGFTLGSHGEYFINRTSNKNIQFPYNKYLAHFCLGIIYSRNASTDIDETQIYNINKLQSITSVIKDFEFFVREKWEIACDRSGSGNTANIGSINRIEDIVKGHGSFRPYGEKIFDDYWMNYNKIIIIDDDGKEHKIRNLKDFLAYRGIPIHSKELGS